MDPDLLVFVFQAAPLIANDAKIEEYVRKRIEEHKETFDPDNIRDYIDLYLRILHQGKTTPTLSGTYLT